MVDPLDSMRDTARQARLSLSAADQARHGELIGDFLLNLLGPLSGLRVAGYLATDGEVDLLPTLAGLCRLRALVYLPIMGPGRSLRFGRWTPGDPVTSSGGLVVNNYGIPEPQDPHPVEASVLDAILVPLVVYDTNAHRAGRGKGYYDRALSSRHQKRWPQRPWLLGIAHQCQQVPTVPQYDHDVALDAVVTEFGTILAKGAFPNHPPNR